MTKNLYKTAKNIGDELIDISESLDSKMERWSDVSRRPYGLSATECVGFINKEVVAGGADGLNLVVDVYAPVDKDEAIVRTWAIIENKSGKGQTGRFNNIQLSFAVNYDKARSVTEKGSDATRDDIRGVLHDHNTQLKRAVVSNMTGIDPASQQSLGERYDVTVDGADDDSIDQAVAALQAVMPTLRKSALVEGNS